MDALKKLEKMVAEYDEKIVAEISKIGISDRGKIELWVEERAAIDDAVQAIRRLRSVA